MKHKTMVLHTHLRPGGLGTPVSLVPRLLLKSNAWARLKIGPLPSSAWPRSTGVQKVRCGSKLVPGSPMGLSRVTGKPVCGSTDGRARTIRLRVTRRAGETRPTARPESKGREVGDRGLGGLTP